MLSILLWDTVLLNGHVAYIEEYWSMYRTFVGKSERKRPLKRIMEFKGG